MRRPQLEWYGWRFYAKHAIAVTRATWYQDLRPVRALLSAISLVIGLFFLFPGQVFDSGPAYSYLREWVDEDVFGACFVLHGVGLTWRNYAPSRVDAWGKVFGLIGISLYTVYPLSIGLALGREEHQFFKFTGQGLALFVLAWACVWCARRVGNGEDKSGA